jgi:hypothetical protein
MAPQNGEWTIDGNGRETVDVRLVYEGPLKSNRGAADKQQIRRVLHSQMRELVGRKSMAHFKRLIQSDANVPKTEIRLRGFRFVPLVTERLNNVAKLHITVLTPEEPGRVVTQGGDLDNRLKTLLDALRVPKNENELPADDAPQSGEDPFFCLLEDDALISGLTVASDRLLRPDSKQSEVLLIIHVTPETTVSNLGIMQWTIM